MDTYLHTSHKDFFEAEYIWVCFIFKIRKYLRITALNHHLGIYYLLSLYIVLVHFLAAIGLYFCLPVPVSTHLCFSALWSSRLPVWDLSLLWRCLLLSSCLLQSVGVVEPFVSPPLNLTLFQFSCSSYSCQVSVWFSISRSRQLL